MYTMEGTIEIPMDEFWQFVMKYSPCEGAEIRFGVPRFNTGNQTMEIDFAADSAGNPDSWMVIPDACQQWKALKDHQEDIRQLEEEIGIDPSLLELKRRRRQWENSTKGMSLGVAESAMEIIAGIDRAIADGRYEDCLRALQHPTKGEYPFIEDIPFAKNVKIANKGGPKNGTTVEAGED